MPIPDDRQLDEYDEDTVEPAALPNALEDGEELEFESAEADSLDDESILDPEESADADSGFGFGDPAD